MSVLPRDPLLGAARLVLSLLMVATLVAAGFFLAASGALTVAPAAALRWLAGATGHAIPAGAADVLALTAATLAAMSVLSFVAQRLLRRVIDSVALGDPFVPENARRLQAMAWLTLAIQAMSIGVASLIGWTVFATGWLRSQFEFSLGGILLTLVLFILARVFRQGTAMREELDGTV